MKLTADNEAINYLKDCFNKDFIEITVDGEKKIFVSEEKLKEKEQELSDEQGYWGGSDLLAKIEVLQELLREE